MSRRFFPSAYELPERELEILHLLDCVKEHLDFVLDVSPGCCDSKLLSNLVPAYIELSKFYSNVRTTRLEHELQEDGQTTDLSYDLLSKLIHRK